MGVTFHWLEGQIRLGPEHEKYGDDWTMIITVQRVGDTAHLSGGNGRLTMDAWKEIARGLYREGFRWVCWERSRKGKMQPRKYPIVPEKIGLERDESGMACALFAAAGSLALIGATAWQVIS